MDYYSEEKFYQDNGWPSERLDYCDYIFYIDNETEYGPDYDQFALVINATYPQGHSGTDPLCPMLNKL